MPTMWIIIHAFTAFRRTDSVNVRSGGGGGKSILFIDANDDWEISSDERRSDFTQQKVNLLLVNKRDQINENKLSMI